LIIFYIDKNKGDSVKIKLFYRYFRLLIKLYYVRKYLVYCGTYDKKKLKQKTLVRSLTSFLF